MLELNSGEGLIVTLVDPRSDHQLLGARYCHGGYIYQVTDSHLGELMETPARPYNVFDGQGIPDSFNIHPLRQAGESTSPTLSSKALVLGVGIVDTSISPRDATTDPAAPTGVMEPATWEVEPTQDTLYTVADGRVRTPQPTIPSSAAPGLRFTTQHEFGGYRVELQRTVSLVGRTVCSNTVVKNTGRAPVPLTWFPHPFFPYAAEADAEETSRLCKFSVGLSLQDCEGYAMDEAGWICRAAGAAGEQPGMGYLKPRDSPSGQMMVLQPHPSLGMVASKISFIPSYFPIWGNSRTFSWEPYLLRRKTVSLSNDRLISFHCFQLPRFTVGGNFVWEQVLGAHHTWWIQRRMDRRVRISQTRERSRDAYQTMMQVCA